MRNSAFGFSSRTRIRRGVNRKTNSSRNAVALARTALKIQDSVSLAVWSATRKLELRGDIPVRTVTRLFSKLVWSDWLCGLPQFDRISLRVMQAGEPAVGIRLLVNLDLDSRSL